jgi:hypothetical protein
MKNPSSTRFWRLPLLSGLLLASCLALPLSVHAQDTTANEGGDLAFGGAGTAPGKFLVLQDIAFDPKGVLYALDGAQMDNKTKQLAGNLRVQKFDNSGKLLGTVDLKTAPGVEWKDDPQRSDLSTLPARVAADSAGDVFVTVPGADKVLEWDAAGKFMRAIDLPQAMAITIIKAGEGERLAVVPSQRKVVQGKGWTWLGGDKIVILTLDGAVEKSIALPQAYENVQDITTDKSGNFYLKAEPNAIYKFSPEGKLLQTFGGNNTGRRPEDGSEVLHTVAVDSKGNVYTMTWGNPGMVTRFDADGKNVTQRAGQFKWADPWSVHSTYVPLAINPVTDRLWAASVNRWPVDYVWYHKQRAVPAIIRARTDFFENPANSVRSTPVRMLGFQSTLKTELPYNVSYEANQPVPMKFTVAPANRNVDEATVNWRAFDALKNQVAAGSARLPLKNGEEAAAGFQWTPPRFGAYLVIADITSPQGTLGALGEHVVVTPRYPQMQINMPAEGDSKDGWSDAARQMWTGLPNMRFHPGLSGLTKPEERAKKLDALDAQITAAEKTGATFLVQIVDNQKNFNADDVRAIMERFKGRIKYVEVCNEPNFSGSIDDYFKIHKAAYEAVKAVDPTVQVMGPAVVNIDLNWIKRLYDLGFKDVTDIISIHDYEGHESIDPVHWRWKFGELRRIMAEHGDANKPIWQTERAIAGVRGNDFQGLVQAIRVSLHQDLLETLGIPSEHDNHYYLRQGGYSAVPTYVWSANGPHPAASVMRTRYALTSALGCKYAGQLDFGPTGNTLFMGVRYAGGDGETVALRNLGAPAGPVEFSMTGATALNVTDAWGTQRTLPEKHGKVAVDLGQLPVFALLGKGQSLVPTSLDFGRNLAPRAAFEYSSTTKSPLGLLNNGVIETYNAGDPNGDTNGAKIWQGDLPTAPQTLTMSFDRPQPVNKIIIRTPRADNNFTTLLDFDLEYSDGPAWKPLAQLHRPMPPSEEAVTADATHAIWMDDTNAFAFQFPTVTAQKFRLVARQTTRGFVPDDRARAWGNEIPQKLMLREVELYAPTLPVRVEAQLQGEGRTRTLQVIARNNGGKTINATLRAFAPAGWNVAGNTPVALAPGAVKTIKLDVALPAVVSAGTNFLDLELRDDHDALLDTNFISSATPAPVELAPQAASSAETTAEGALVKLAIKNTSAAPLSGQAVLSLRGPSQKAPLEQNFAAIAPGQSATVSWRVPQLDLAGQRWSADFAVTANGVLTEAQKDLFGQLWSVVGPFPRGFDVPEGPEKALKFDPEANFVDMVGANHRWQAVAPDAAGLVNLADLIKPNTDVMAYAVAIVTSPKAQKALFSVGTDDGGKGWLNGQVVYADDGSHGAAPGQQQIPVELKAGRNEVWLKVTQGNGGWGFYFDLLDPQTGKPLNNIVYAAR